MLINREFSWSFLLTLPLNCLATSRAAAVIFSASAWLFPTNTSKWFLISPPKIFCALSWLNSMTKGKDSVLTNLTIASEVISPSKATLGLSKFLSSKTAASDATSYSLSTSASAVIPKRKSSTSPAAARKALAASDSRSYKQIDKNFYASIFASIIYLEKTENGNITSCSKFLSFFNSGNSFGGRTSLLQQPVDNFVSSATTL